MNLFLKDILFFSFQSQNDLDVFHPMQEYTDLEYTDTDVEFYSSV